MNIFLDTETYSSVDIKKHGMEQYFDSPDSEVMIITYAVDDGPVRCIDLINIDCRHHMQFDEFAAQVNNPSNVIVAHNAPFDQAAMRKLGIHISDSRLEDTAALSRAVGLPGGLAGACKASGVPQEAQKKRGARLINMFCKPTPKHYHLRRYTYETHPEDWAEFLEYAIFDVVAMRELYRRLPKANDL